MVVYHDRNLIINYIPRNLSDSDLSNLFSTVGPIKTCRIIRDHSSGSSFGFGFCEYEDVESAHRAIERFNGYRISDKILKVSLAKLQGRLCHSSNLYVKNFPMTVNDEEIAREFSQFGKVLQCRILRDRDTNASKGSAYVLFDSRVDAEAARKALDGTFWPGSDGQPLVIKFATPPYRQPSSVGQTKNNNRRTPGSSQPEEQSCLGTMQNKMSFVCDSTVKSCSSYSQDHFYPNSTVPIPPTLPVPFTMQPSPNVPGMAWAPEYLPDNVGMTPFPLTPAYFPPYILAQNAFPGFWPQVPQNPSTLPFGFVYDQQLDGLSNAMNGCPVLTGLPSSFQTNGFQNSAALRGILSGLLTDDSGMKKIKNKNDKSNVASVYVYNIGNLMTERRLSELFNRFGAVLNVSIPKDPKTNFTRNFGFVTFNSLHSAQLAINSMNGFVYDGRRLQVSLRKPKNSVIRSTADVSSKIYVDVPDTETMAEQTDLSSCDVKPDNTSILESCEENLQSLHLTDVITSQNSMITCCPSGITT